MIYEVTIKEIEVYVIGVDAESQEEAVEKANLLMEAGKEQYHNDSENESEAVGI